MPSAQYFREQAEALRRHARASRRRRRLPPNWIIVRLSKQRTSGDGDVLLTLSGGGTIELNGVAPAGFQPGFLV